MKITASAAEEFIDELSDSGDSKLFNASYVELYKTLIL